MLSQPFGAWGLSAQLEGSEKILAKPSVLDFLVKLKGVVSGKETTL